MESGSLKAEAALGAVVLAALAALVWAGFVLGSGTPRDAKHYTLIFDSAIGLSVDNLVSVAGVKIGVVEKITTVDGTAQVQIAVEKEAHIYQDAQAAVRSKTLLGEKYVDVLPGHQERGELADQSIITNNFPTVDVDEVIRSASVLLQTLNQATPALLRSAERLDKLSAILDENQEPLLREAKSLHRDVTATLQAVHDIAADAGALLKSSSKDVRKLLKHSAEKGPPLLDSLGKSAARLEAITGAIDPATIASASQAVPPVLDELRTTLQDLREAGQSLQKYSPDAKRMLKRLDTLLGRIESLDEMQLRSFLQVEGVRVNLWPSPEANAQIQQLQNQAPQNPKKQ